MAMPSGSGRNISAVNVTPGMIGGPTTLIGVGQDRIAAKPSTTITESTGGTVTAPPEGSDFFTGAISWVKDNIVDPLGDVLTGRRVLLPGGGPGAVSITPPLSEAVPDPGPVRAGLDYKALILPGLLFGAIVFIARRG